MTEDDVVFVGHSHFSRSVITRWVELPLVEGSRFWMLAGSIAALGLTSIPQAITPR
jgi:broad specificity phosphatase PhoE